MLTYKSKNRPYDIVSHDPVWKETFSDESKKIKSIFGDVALQIEHVGSTAVPSLSAKPTVDILVIVDKASDADQFNSQMGALGYENMGGLIAEDTRMFQKEVEGHRLFIVHVFEKDHPHTADMIKTRDYLITHPEEIETYDKIKKNLKKQFPDDYLSYRKEKDKYVAELTKRALDTNPN